MNTCATCQHHDPQRNWCRANPPRVLEANVPDPDSGYRRVPITVWPVVNPDIDRCGEHRRIHTAAIRRRESTPT